MVHDEFEKRSQDPDFEKIRNRVKVAVANDPELKMRVDTNEQAFCNLYDRVGSDLRRQRIAIHEAPRPIREPARLLSEPSPEQQRRASLLERASQSGDLRDVAVVIDYLETTRKED